MMPSTGTMAILLGESLSSITASSNFGPAVRVGLVLPLRIARRKCNGLNTTLIRSRQAKTTTATFHPPPRLRGGGAASRGGAGSKGGGVGAFGALIGGILLSIAANLNPRGFRRQVGFLPACPVALSL